MKKSFLYILLLLLSIGCSGRTAQTGSAPTGADEPTLTVSASPRQGFTPLRINFRAVLEGVSGNEEEYYCLQEEWDFGDGAKSSEQPNCPPYSPDAKIKTEFFMEHVYEDDGHFTVRLVLGDKKVRSRQVTVAILERASGRPD